MFRGGCTLEAAEQVCQAELDVVESLVDKSLLRVDEERDGDPRFSMLETLREYAGERLEAAADADEVRSRHLRYFLALAERAEPELTGAEQASWLDRLDDDLENLRAALSWSRDSGAAEMTLRLAASLRFFWRGRGHINEGRRWLAEAVSRGGPAEPIRAKALSGASLFAWLQGDHPQARLFAEESLAILRALGDRAGTARALSNLASVICDAGDYVHSRELHEESLALYEEVGDQRGVAIGLQNLAYGAIVEGDYERAEDLGRRCLVIQRGRGDPRGSAVSIFNLGLAALFQGRSEAAFRFLEESLRLSQSIGDREYVALCLGALADVHAGRGDPARGAALLAAADGVRGSISARLEPAERELLDRTNLAIRQQLAEDECAAAWEEGRRLEVDEAVTLALSTGGESYRQS